MLCCWTFAFAFEPAPSEEGAKGCEGVRRGAKGCEGVRRGAKGLEGVRRG